MNRPRKKDPSNLSKGRERGQGLILSVLVMGAIFGFTAMALDVGMIFRDRRHLQNAADAAALAGAAELPMNPARAVVKARQWAKNNGLDSSQVKTIQVRSANFPNDTIYVKVEEQFDWIFAKVLDQDQTAVSADAAARVEAYGGGHNIMPWGLLKSDSSCLQIDGTPILNADCSVKIGAGSSITGWYGALDLDGNGGGSAEYEANIIDGESETLYCARYETTPSCESVVDTLAGNKVGGTDHAIDERLSREPTCDDSGNGHDDFEEVFAASDGTGPAYSVICPQSPRLIFIPVVSFNSVPIQQVTIEGWAIAYLHGYHCVILNCTGAGNWVVDVEVVETNYSDFPGIESNFNPTTTVTARELVQ